MLSKEAKTVMAQVPDALRFLTKRASSLEAENDTLRTKLAERELRDRAVKVAAEMADKNFVDEDEVETKVAELVAEGADNLAVKEQAVKLAARQMMDLTPDDDRSGSGKSELEAYILGE